MLDAYHVLCHICWSVFTRFVSQQKEKRNWKSERNRMRKSSIKSNKKLAMNYRQRPPHILYNRVHSTRFFPPELLHPPLGLLLGFFIMLVVTAVALLVFVCPLPRPSYISEARYLFTRKEMNFQGNDAALYKSRFPGGIFLFFPHCYTVM